jgi:hypothetical protein
VQAHIKWGHTLGAGSMDLALFSMCVQSRCASTNSTLGASCHNNTGMIKCLRLGGPLDPAACAPWMVPLPASALRNRDGAHSFHFAPGTLVFSYVTLNGSISGIDELVEANVRDG